MIKEYALKKIIDLAITSFNKMLFESKSKLLTHATDIHDKLSLHQKFVKNWSTEIAFRDLKSPKVTNKVYVELDLFLYPRRIRIDSRERIKSISLSTAISKAEKHIILLGQPGAGKTTSMKYLCHRILHDESFCSETINFPLVIRLREFNQRRSKKSDPNKSNEENTLIIDKLLQLLGIDIEISDNMQLQKGQTKTIALKENLLIEALEKFRPLVILDGFDELTYVTHKDQVLEEIKFLCSHVENALIIVTSRTSDFIFNVDGAMPYEICALNDKQIFNFSLRWLGNKKSALNFLKQMKDSPFNDTMIRPLTIAHLCAIYERIGKIPDKPKTVYKKIVNLLLEEWDEQRSIQRASKYANFEIDRKFEFLSNLAFEMTVTLRKSVFQEDDLQRIYEKICRDFDLLKNESSQVVSEIETHTGLFVQSGYKQYEFAHKSIQEYLTAEFIVKLPNIPTNTEVLLRLPNELAIAITISSRPSQYLTELVLNRFTKAKRSFNFIKAFVNRLLLEKPDFNINDEVALAVLQLYSIYTESQLYDQEQLSLFIFDPLRPEFKKFVEMVLNKSNKSLVSINYQFSESIATADGRKIFKLIKKQNASSEYPREIYADKNFFEFENKEK